MNQRPIYAPEPTTMACLKCAEPLDPVLTNMGLDYHPMCDPECQADLEPVNRQKAKPRIITIPTKISPGRQLGLIGEALVLSHEGDWKERAGQAINQLVAKGDPFTAEDVRALAGDPDHPNSMGAALSKAARAGRISAIGWGEPSRTERHGNKMRIWQPAQVRR
jgi:hypothetical protein